jgi:hypothetical protein
MSDNITINTQTARDELQRLAKTVDGPDRVALMRVLGRGLEGDLREHFLRKNQKPNKKGYPKSNFWARIRRSTNFAGATEGDATVAVADPAFATHLYGATIRPKRSKFLTIPIAPESYGKRVAEMEDDSIFFLPRRRGGGFLARPLADGSNRLLYFLTRQVTVPRDPDALPSPATLNKKAIARARSHLARVIDN